LLVGVVPAPASPGWVSVLQQEGMSFASSAEPVAPITLVAGSLPSWTEAYVSRGGVIALSGAVSDGELLPSAEPALVHRFRVPNGEDWAEAPGIVRLFRGPGAGQIRLHENRTVRNGNEPDVYPAVLTKRVGAGSIIWSGIPLTELLVAGGDRLRRFSPLTSVTERVSSIDKAEVAETLVWMLQRAFALAAVPYVRLARFPDGAASVFVFRVDVDGIFGERTNRLAEDASAAGMRISVYLNGSLSEAHPGELGAGLDAHEIGHHGYIHDVFDDVATNAANLAHGADWVRHRLGREPSGFVSPRGLWNRSLERALLDTDHDCSGDFALAFDAHPFRTPGGVLQVPVHPFSPERAVNFASEAGEPVPTAEAVASHYVATARRQLSRQRPIHLYGHPEVLGTMAADVFPPLVAATRTAGVPNLTVGEYARWWMRREQAGLCCTASASELGVSFDGEQFPIEVLVDAAVTVRAFGQEWRLPGDAGRTVLTPRGHAISAPGGTW
jgi:hypothetical protein